MKTIFTALKIALVLAVLNGLFRFGTVAWAHYQLKDAAQEIVLFAAGKASNSELQKNVFDKAQELGVPLAMEQIDVSRGSQRTMIKAAYTWPVEYFPRQVYPLALSFDVEAFVPVGAPTAR